MIGTKFSLFAVLAFTAAVEAKDFALSTRPLRLTDWNNVHLLSFSSAVLQALLRPFCVWPGMEDHRVDLAILTAEADVLEKGVAGLSLQEFKDRLLLGAVPGQPPRWRDPRFAKVIPLYFGLLDDARATALLPLLWDLHDQDAPEETALFAAACFFEIKHREKHPDFASRLQLELVSLIESRVRMSILTVEQIEVYEKSRRRAVRAIARLWGDARTGHPWLWKELENRQRNTAVLEEIMEQLGGLMGKNEKLQERLLVFIGENHRDFGLRPKAVATLAQVWGRRVWVQALLLTLMEKPDESVYVRSEAMKALGKVWGREEWLRTRLLELVCTTDEEWFVRYHAAAILGQVWGAQDWLREHLTSLVNKPKENRLVRYHAVEILGHVFGREEWLKELLVEIVQKTEEDFEVRGQAVMTLGQVWGLQDWLKELLLNLVKQSGRDMYNIRWYAVKTLGQITGREGWLRELLAALAQNAEEDVVVRREAILVLGQVWGSEDWWRELLVPLAQDNGENEDVRQAAMDTLGRVCGRQEWLRGLLVTVVMQRDAPSTNQSKNHSKRPRSRWDFHHYEWLRQETMCMLCKVWGNADWLRQLLSGIVADPHEHVYMRHRTIEILALGWGREDWLRDLLMGVVKETKLDKNLRYQAVYYLRELWPELKVK